jgi:uncharacterized hydrophobic protein (TIGR00271 family)
MENTKNTSAADRSAVLSEGWAFIAKFIHNLLDIRQDSSAMETIDAVRKDISFQGHNAWILIFSIIIASVGLNANSTAVVIGAMLISPLMGPIVGMGLGTAINDATMLRRSLLNLGVMVGLSLLTATLYFLITPIIEFTEELRARTYPTILDVLIAIFGGLALIVAKAKKGTISNAIAGVAIATALMPPLCTAGYGIASGNLSVFGGAMYLFLINSVFIALATFIVCKLLKFPVAEYATEEKMKRVSRFATFLGLLVLTPSIYLFVQLIREQQFKNEVDKFVETYIQFKGTRSDAVWNYQTKQLDIVLMGNSVPDYKKEEWVTQFKQATGLKDTNIAFFQNTNIVAKNGDIDLVQKDLINTIKQSQSKDDQIAQLRNELKRLKDMPRDLNNINTEVALLFPEVSTISYAPMISKNLETKKLDTTDLFKISYKSERLDDARKKRVLAKMQDWLRYRVSATCQVTVLTAAEKEVLIKKDAIPE